MQSTQSYFIIDLVCVSYLFNIIQTASKEASILFVLAILNQLDTSYNLRGENLDWENASMRSGCIFLFSDWWWKTQPIVSGAISELVVLGAIRKQATQNMRNKPVRRTPLWSWY